MQKEAANEWRASQLPWSCVCLFVRGERKRAGPKWKERMHKKMTENDSENANTALHSAHNVKMHRCSKNAIQYNKQHTLTLALQSFIGQRVISNGLNKIQLTLLKCLSTGSLCELSLLIPQYSQLPRLLGLLIFPDSFLHIWNFRTGYFLPTIRLLLLLLLLR